MTAQDWKHRHQQAKFHPNSPQEHRINALMAALGVVVDSFTDEFGSDAFPDAVATPAIGSIIEGTRTLLNFDTGRLDAGTVDRDLEHLAGEVGWDLDLSEIVWEAS